MSMGRFRDFIISLIGEEYSWKEYIFNTDGIQVIKKLASRPPEMFKKDFDKATFLPRIAIQGVMDEIETMTTSETTGEVGGFYLAFVRGLIEEIEDSRTDSPVHFQSEFESLNRIIGIDRVGDLEATKTQVAQIYRNFMMNSSSYGDAEYEGAALAEALGMHIIVKSTDQDGNVYQSVYGPDASEDVPTITLRFTQGNRNAHYVLDKVNDHSIPHSIYGDGDCLFSSIAQGILELYIQNSGEETASTLAQRRVSQTYKGFELGLIPRSKFLEMLQSSNDLFRQEMCEKLCNLIEPLQDSEVDILRDLMKYDAYQTVRIAASKVLYIKGMDGDRQIAKQIITELLVFPGFGMEHCDGYDLVREQAAEAISFFIKDAKQEFMIDPLTQSNLHNLMMHDAFQTVRIACAKALYLGGNEENKRLAEGIITKLVSYTDSDGSTESIGAQIVRTKAIEKIAILEQITQEISEQLEYLKDHESSISAKRAALQTLNELGLFRNERWSILIDKETQARYATNGQVKLVLSLHPYGCIQDMAMHKLLLDNKDSYVGNFILLLQKFLATGPAEYPNKHSVPFLQALKYSINEYYRFPGSEEEKFVSRLFALPGNVTPTLEMFDLLLKDFISKDPQGEWTTHKQGLSHYQFMYTKHKEVEKAIEDNSQNIYREVINIIMASLVENLYAFLDLFSARITGVEFSKNEQKFMEELRDKSTHNNLIKLSNEGISNILFGRYLSESNKTSYMYTKMVMIHSTHNLLPRLKKQSDDKAYRVQEHMKYVYGTAKAKEHQFQDPIKDFISFLLELREKIYCNQGAQQMLGIGFEGRFFGAPRSSSFEDEPTIHLGFTEKFRIVGGVFLEHVILSGLRDHLSKVLGTKIQVRVDSYVDHDLKLMYHYALSQMWERIIEERDDVDERLTLKLTSLVAIDLNAKVKQNPTNPKSKEDLERIQAYLEVQGGTLDMLNIINQKLNPSKGSGGKKLAAQPLTVEEQKIFNAFGKYIINEKILVCIETQLIPVLHSGLVFPVMLKNVTDKDPFLSFYLDKLRIRTLEHVFQFAVAKPCDKFCQPASTAYDLISEIHSQFAEVRGFTGSLVARKDFKKSVVPFLEEELAVIETGILNTESFIDERHKVYECYRLGHIGDAISLLDGLSSE